MTHTFEIKETPKSKAIIEHLLSLTYVKHKNGKEQKVLSEDEMIAAVRKSEKSKSIPLEEVIKQSEKWKFKVV